MFIPILSVVTAIFATLTILLRRKGKSFEGMLCKFISSFGFMSMAFIGFCYRIEICYSLHVYPVVIQILSIHKRCKYCYLSACITTLYICLWIALCITKILCLF